VTYTERKSGIGRLLAAAASIGEEEIATRIVLACGSHGNLAKKNKELRKGGREEVDPSPHPPEMRKC
jgi:hypothetical protein